jgi:general secretion pathway protein G
MKRFIAKSQGFTLIELVMTMAIMAILTAGIIPLIKVSVKRQREQQLREALRQMRSAIQEFHRDTVGAQCTGEGAAGAGLEGAAAAGNRVAQNPNNPNAATPYVDPRSKVMISDCKIFTVDNPDRYPPDLQTLVDGVSVTPRTQDIGGGGKSVFEQQATKDALTSLKKKVYLRAIPVDPMTGKAEWDLRSNFDTADTQSTGGENVFDVRSKSKETALNGKDKYNEW